MSIFTKKTKTTETKSETQTKTQNGKSLNGVVVSTKMKDTIVVCVNRFVKVPKYERFMKISKKYKAHDAGNTKKEGETVTIVECAPISRDKHFRVI
ncbi:MAG: 30S ribosomal protein S17 [bacterium]|nr:30S ribosomal protein S17 [bacterium]